MSICGPELTRSTYSTFSYKSSLKLQDNENIILCSECTLFQYNEYGTDAVKAAQLSIEWTWNSNRNFKIMSMVRKQVDRYLKSTVPGGATA